MENNTLIYDTPILYGQHMDNDSQNKFMEFYRSIFSNYKISSIHDCTIGAGGSTLPLAKLGYTVSGSDISENLLNKCKENFLNNGFSPNLFIADFRYIGDFIDTRIDCLISTGNSLPHVDINGFNVFLQTSNKILFKDGLLFFDIRNWDTINDERPIIHAMDPIKMTSDEHISRYLLFNWHDNGSVTFSFATSTDKNGKHDSIYVISVPVYYPLFRKDISKSLKENGYKIINYYDMDKYWLSKGMEKEKKGDFEKDFEKIQWYGVLAQKNEYGDKSGNNR